jgi:hypothetical protein
VDPAKLRYARIFYDGCLSGLYYLDGFHHGVVFYTVGDTYFSEFETYLRGYMQGASDAQLWAALQDLQNLYDYYDFSRSPKEQNTQQAESPEVIAEFHPRFGTLARRWARSPPDRVLEALRRPEFIHNERSSRTFVLAAFQDRQPAAIALALRQMALPLIERTEGHRLSKIRGLIAARRILEAFPEAAIPPLLEAYEKADLMTKGNIIRASGKISRGPEIKNLLLRALADQSFCDKEDWQTTGTPLRLCDLAYNELVLHYGVKGVLRTISSPYTIDTRDYHIGVLKAKL